jgi:hypothetical protein
VLTISEDAVMFNRGNGIPVKLTVPINTSLMEILWAPNSQSFAINVSDGENAGPWHAFIYLLGAARETPVLLPVDAEIEKTLAEFPRCVAHMRANLAAVAWLSDGREILLAVEAPPLAACRNKGGLLAFKVSATSGKILERIAEQSLTQQWAREVGCRLRRD